MFLLLTIVLAVGGGLAALEVVPGAAMMNKRSAEERLAQHLGELRTAMALERATRSTPLFESNWNIRSEFLAYLGALQTLGFMRGIPVDPMILPEQWGSEPAQIFWLPTFNLVASSNFDVTSLASTPWKTGSKKIEAGLTTENAWTGDSLAPRGTSLKLTKP
jgi:hypothetical protein